MYKIKATLYKSGFFIFTAKSESAKFAYLNSINSTNVSADKIEER